MAPVCKDGGWYGGKVCGEVGSRQEASVVSGQGLDQEEIRDTCSDFNMRQCSQKNGQEERRRDGRRGKVEAS